MRRHLVSLLILAFFSMANGCGGMETSTPAQVVLTPDTPASPGPATVPRTVEASATSTPPATAPGELARTSPTILPTATTSPTPALAASPTPAPTPAAAFPVPTFSYPIGTAGRPPGDGFFIRHGAAVENTWYNPGYWHTGEDWYAVEGDTAGALVYAIADGEVVYVGSNYPGRVVIIRHGDDLYSMYGHLDPAVSVGRGDRVARGDVLGTVLRRGDATPNHLHFEIRTFLEAREVNGAVPRYNFRCGRNCPPGPGYWPIEAPDHPSDIGWRNPTHVINARMFPPGASAPLGEVTVATEPISPSVTLWSALPGEPTRQALGELELRTGEHFSLLEIQAGPEHARGTSALAYELWYRVGLPNGQSGWVHAAVPSPFETGSDGRPSTVYFNFFPAEGRP